MLTALVATGAMLLLAAGAAKAVDPSRTVGALTELGLPVTVTAVRAGGVVEAVIGAATLVVGGRALAGLVGASFAVFAVFVVVALRSGAPIGTCGCFGRADTPPRWGHVALDLVVAAAGLTGLATGVSPVVDASPPVIVAAVALAAAGYLVLTAPSTRPPHTTHHHPNDASRS